MTGQQSQGRYCKSFTPEQLYSARRLWKQLPFSIFTSAGQTASYRHSNVGSRKVDAINQHSPAAGLSACLRVQAVVRRSTGTGRGPQVYG